MKKMNLTKYELKIKSRKPEFTTPEREMYMALCRGEQVAFSFSSLMEFINT